MKLSVWLWRRRSRWSSDQTSRSPANSPAVGRSAPFVVAARRAGRVWIAIVPSPSLTHVLEAVYRAVRGGGRCPPGRDAPSTHVHRTSRGDGSVWYTSAAAKARGV